MKVFWITTWLLVSQLTYALSQQVDAEYVLKKHIEAIGGANKLKKIKAFVLEGETHTNGLDGKITITLIRPGKVRTEMDVRGHKIIRAFDGKRAWINKQLAGSNVTSNLKDTDVFNDLSGIPVQKLLVYPQKKQFIELVGEEIFEGKKSYKIKFEEPEKYAEFYYFDKETFYLIGREIKTKKAQKEVLSDFRSINGITVAHSIKNLTNNREIVLQKVHMNPKLADSLFEFPGR